MLYKKTEKTYLLGIKILVFLIPFIPFYISTSLVFPFVTGKNFAFRILVEAAAVLWAGLMVLNRRYRPQSSAILLSVLVFTLIVGVADMTGVNPYKSFWSNYQRMEGYITILHLVLYFMILKSVLGTKKEWMLFFNIFVAVSVIVALYAFVIPSAGIVIPIYGERVSSTLGNPPFLASYLLLSVFLALIACSNTGKHYVRFLYLLIVVLHLATIYLTATRGAILSVIAGVIIFGLLFIYTRSGATGQRIFRRAVVVSVAAIVLLSALFLTVDNSGFINRDWMFSRPRSDESPSDRFKRMFTGRSAKSRLRAWEVAWDGVRERPLLGWGQEGLIDVYSVTPVPYSEMIWTWMDRTHNIIMHWLINAGFAGLFSYLLIFGTAFYCLKKAYNKNTIAKGETVVIATALAVYFIQNLFIFDTINTYLIFFALLAYLSYNCNTYNTATDKSKSMEYSDTENIKFKFIGATLCALLFFSAAAYFANYKPLRAAQWLNRVSVSIQKDRGSLSTVFDYFRKALSYETFGDSEITMKMFNVSLLILNNRLFTQKDASKLVEMTLQRMEKLVSADPLNLTYWTYLIKLYHKVAFFDSSFIDREEALIRKCLQLNPEYQWLYYALADNYILKKDYGNIISLAPDVELDPQNDTARLKLALGGLLASREDMLNRAMEAVRRIRMSRDDDVSSGRKPVFSIDELLVFAGASAEMKNFDKEILFYRELLDIAPENADFHFNMAQAYLKTGDVENARRHADKAAELDPGTYSGKIKSLPIY
ncbi:MAG: O-antigen ligase family protein [Deferribacteres bacterium]|nr:O-antigen ligase family protein [Deferribacteres bacterium]